MFKYKSRCANVKNLCKHFDTIHIHTKKREKERDVSCQLVCDLFLSKNLCLALIF